MKVKIIQMFLDGQIKDYRKLADLSKQINQTYAKLHNYEYKFVELDKELIKKELDEVNWNTVVAYKQKFIADQLDGCDLLAFIDVDAAVSNPNIKIEDLVDQDHSLFLSRGNGYQFATFQILYDRVHDYMFKDQRFRNQFVDQKLMKDYDFFRLFESFSMSFINFNEGFYVIKNTDQMKQFFLESYELEKKYFLHYAWKSDSAVDGRSIRFLLLTEKYQGIYGFMYDQALAGIANYGKTRYNVNTCFIEHNWGDATNMNQKIYLLEDIKKNQWWKKLIQNGVVDWGKGN